MITVAVTIKLVVESDVDPRNPDGTVPYEFKHMSPTAEVVAFLDHLSEQTRDYIDSVSSISVSEFEILEPSTCRHCGRSIVDENGKWIDPAATGDDSVWRETCDAHDTFTAEHEPEQEFS